MNIIVDTRESGLITQLKTSNVDILISQESLDIGDIHLCKPDGTIYMIIERKTIQDLAASIRDGRYKEQSIRLSQSNIPNHHILFMIEGDIDKYTPVQYSKNPLQQSALYSSIVSMLYFKGFSVLFTKNIQDTSNWILRFADKMIRTNETPYYNTNEQTIQPSVDYVSHIKMKKQSNITPDNIDEIILCQIPGISNTIAKAILTKYISFKQLLYTLEKTPTILNDFSYLNKQGNNRKLSKTVISNIITYLKISS